MSPIPVGSRNKLINCDVLKAPTFPLSSERKNSIINLQTEYMIKYVPATIPCFLIFIIIM